MAYSIFQTKRLLQIDLPGVDVGYYITKFSGVETVSKPFAFRATVHFHGAVDLRELLGNPIIITIEKGKASRLFHGCITKAFDASDAPPLSAGERCCELIISPFTFYMNKNQDYRVFENLSVVEIAKQLCYERLYYDIDLKQLKNKYPPIEHAVQYNETDFAFLQRLFAYYGINYYFEFKKDGHYLVLIDEKTPLTGIGELTFHYSDATDADFSDWHSDYQLMPNKAIHRSLNPDSPTRIVEAVNINKNAYTKNLARGYLEQEFYIQTFDPVNDVPRLNKQQLAYWNRMQRKHGGDTQLLTMKPAIVFKLNHRFDTKKNINYIITEVSHHAVDNSHRTVDNQDIVQAYSNKIICFEKNDGITPEPNYNMPEIRGVQSAFVAGRKSQHPNMQDTMKTQIRHVWDRKSDTATYPLYKVRYASPMASTGYGTMIQPRAESEVLVQYLDGNPANPVIIGGMYNKKHPPAISTKENPLHNVIRSKTLGGTDAKQHNEIQFVDKPRNEQINIHAANKHITGIAQEANSTIGGNLTHQINGDNTITATGDITHTSFQKITLNAGKSQIEILPNAINITSNLVKAGNPGSPVVCAMETPASKSPFDTVPAFSPMPKRKYPEATIHLDPITTKAKIYIPVPLADSLSRFKNLNVSISTSGELNVIKNILINPDDFDQEAFYNEALLTVIEFLDNLHVIGLKDSKIKVVNENINFTLDFNQASANKIYFVKQTYKDYFIHGNVNFTVKSDASNLEQQQYDYILPSATVEIAKQTIDLGTTMLTPNVIMNMQMTFEGTATATAISKMRQENYKVTEFDDEIQKSVDEIMQQVKFTPKMDWTQTELDSLNLDDDYHPAEIKLTLETSGFLSKRYKKYTGKISTNVEKRINGLNLSIDETISLVVSTTNKDNSNTFPMTKKATLPTKINLLQYNQIEVPIRALMKPKQNVSISVRFLNEALIIEQNLFFMIPPPLNVDVENSENISADFEYSDTLITEESVMSEDGILSIIGAMP